jgi:hypothetical protein
MHFEFVPTHRLALTVPCKSADWTAAARRFVMHLVGLPAGSQKPTVLMGLRCTWTTWRGEGITPEVVEGKVIEWADFVVTEIKRLATRN